MTKEELQKKIDDGEWDLQNMKEIAKSYLRGDIIHDTTAAEAWLRKIIDREEGIYSMEAMALLAKEIWKKEEILSDEDYLHICKIYQQTYGEERKELEYLLSLATERQKKIK